MENNQKTDPTIHRKMPSLGFPKPLNLEMNFNEHMINNMPNFRDEINRLMMERENQEKKEHDYLCAQKLEIYYKTQIQDLMVKFDYFVKLNEMYELQIKSLVFQNKKLVEKQSQIKLLTTTIQRMSQQKKISKGHNQEMNKDYEKYKYQIKQLHQKLGKKQEMNETLQKQMIQIEQANKQLQKQLQNKYQSQIQILSEENKTYKQDNSKLEFSIRQKARKYDQKAVQFQQARQNFDELQKRYKQMENKAIKEKNIYCQIVKTKDNQLQRLNKTIISLSKQVQDLKNDAKKLNQTYQNLKLNCSKELQRKQNEWNGKYEQIKNTTNGKYKQIQKLLQKSKRECSSLRDEAISLRTKQQNSRKQLQQKLNGQRIKINQLKIKQQKLNNDLNNKEKDLSDARKQLNEMNKQIEENKLIIVRYEKMKAQKEHIQYQYKKIQIQLKTLGDKNEDLKRHYDSEIKRVEQNKNKQKQELKEQKDRTIQYQNKLLDQRKNQFLRERQGRANLQQKLKQKKAEYDGQLSQIQILRLKIKSLQQRDANNKAVINKLMHDKENQAKLAFQEKQQLINSMEIKKDESFKSLAISQENLWKKDSEIRQLQYEINAYKDKLKRQQMDKVQQIIKKQNLLSQKNKEKQVLEQKCRDFQTKIRQLQNEKKELSIIIQSSNKVKGQLDRANKKIFQLQGNIKQINLQTRQNNDQISKLKMTIQQHMTNSNQLNDQLERTQKQKQLFKQSNYQLKNGIQKLNSRILEYDKCISALKQQKSKITHSLNANIKNSQQRFKKDIQELNQKLKSYQQQIIVKNKQITKIQSLNCEMIQRANNLEQQINKNIQRHSKQINDLNARILQKESQLDAQKNKLITELQQVKSKLDKEYKSKIEITKQKDKQLSSLKQSLQQTKKEAQKRYEEQERTYSQYCSKTQSFKTQIIGYKLNIDRLNLEKQLLQTCYDSYKRKWEEMIGLHRQANQELNNQYNKGMQKVKEMARQIRQEYYIIQDKHDTTYNSTTQYIKKSRIITPLDQSIARESLYHSSYHSSLEGPGSSQSNTSILRDGKNLNQVQKVEDKTNFKIQENSKNYIAKNIIPTQDRVQNKFSKTTIIGKSAVYQGTSSSNSKKQKKGI